jgi:hypothetical protein
MTLERIPWKRIPFTIFRLTIPSGIGPVRRTHQGGDATSEQKALSINELVS